MLKNVSILEFNAEKLLLKYFYWKSVHWNVLIEKMLIFEWYLQEKIWFYENVGASNWVPQAKELLREKNIYYWPKT